MDTHPTQEPDNMKTNNIFVTIIQQDELKKSYSDQTGRVPFMSALGNNYVFIMYDYDTNIILEEPIASR